VLPENLEAAKAQVEPPKPAVVPPPVARPGEVNLRIESRPTPVQPSLDLAPAEEPAPLPTSREMLVDELRKGVETPPEAAPERPPMPGPGASQAEIAAWNKAEEARVEQLLQEHGMGGEAPPKTPTTPSGKTPKAAAPKTRTITKAPKPAVEIRAPRTEEPPGMVAVRKIPPSKSSRSPRVLNSAGDKSPWTENDLKALEEAGLSRADALDPDLDYVTQKEHDAVMKDRANRASAYKAKAELDKEARGGGGSEEPP
jgi:hypothetical protein